MEIGAPTWKPRETSYTFPIHNANTQYKLVTTAQYFEDNVTPESPPLEEEDKVQVIVPFIDAFISKTKSRFASPLVTKNVLSRLTHIWYHSDGPTVPTAGWYKCTWTPKEFIVKPREFGMVWAPIAIEPDEARIPSEFLESTTPGRQSPAPELRTFQIQPLTTSHGLLELDLPLTDPSDSRLLTLEYDVSEHTTEKKRVREAKLRAALASLKAERLSEKYYQKYGIQPGDESSEGSSESETEDETY